MVRQRGAAVRYASKEAADSDKLLVKANRTLHVDVCVSGNNCSNGQNIATAVGVQGWRKTMEDAHVVWLKQKKDENNNNNNNNRRFFRSFVCGSLDTEHHHLRHHVATTATTTHASENNNNGTEEETNQNRDVSPAPVHVGGQNPLSASSATSSTAPTPRLSLAPSVAAANSNDTNNKIDLFGDAFLLPNNNNNNQNNNGEATPSSSSPLSALSLNEQLSNEFDLLTEATSIQGYIAVFDGHGGDKASKFCGEHLGSILFKEIANIEKTRDLLFSSLGAEEIQEVFNRAFLECDSQLRAYFFGLQQQEASNNFAGSNNNGGDDNSSNNNNNGVQLSSTANINPSIFLSPTSPSNTTNSGTTAAGAVILHDSIILFSVGDCRSGIFSVRRHSSEDTEQNDANFEQGGKATVAATEDGDDSSPLSSSPSREVVPKLFDTELLGKLDDDHRPGASAIEKDRLEKIGAKVVNGRVGGKLSVSRAFGDFSLKKNNTNNNNNNNNGSDDDENENEEYLRTKNPIYQYPVVCVPELRIVSLSQQSQSEPILIAVGCDGVYETQELLKLPDLVLNHHHQQQHLQQLQNNNNGNGNDDEANHNNNNNNNNNEANNQQQSNGACSGSIFGTVRVAQRSISLSHPISPENGGLLPGSDNVTFITCLLRENFFTSAASNKKSLVISTQQQQQHHENDNDGTPTNQNGGQSEYDQDMKHVVSSIEPLSPAQVPQVPQADQQRQQEQTENERKPVVSPREKSHTCC